MQWYCEPFADKKITVLGLGLLGRGVGDVEFLAKCGAKVLATDKKDEEELKESVERLKKYPNVTFHLGGHNEKDFTSADMVVKAAGVPLNSPEVAAACKADVPVYMSTALFSKYAANVGATVVGVTGTRGKTTTAHMIYHCLQETKKHEGLNRAEGAVGRTILPGKIVLGGNVRGVSTLALLPEIQKEDITVLELDSWQMQGFGDMRISPHIAVFTNLYPDHQNYYEDMDEYFADKANIFKYQKEGDSLIVGNGLVERLKAAQPPVEPLFPRPLTMEWTIKVPGEHNRDNAALAAGALRALGISEADIKSGLESFGGVEGRLQFVREVHGVNIYNDNNATTPEATMAALNSLQGDIALIVGGSEKNLALDELVVNIRGKVKRVVVLTHPKYKGSERLVAELQKGDTAYDEAASLEEAIKKGLEGMQSGDLLFSPAFTSFGMFKNEYDRNDQFLQVVRSLA
ncbi:MAG: Mur ligase family protein [bacterium]|nr:Mur ligase family protein [bacterium]